VLCDQEAVAMRRNVKVLLLFSMAWMFVIIYYLQTNGDSKVRQIFLNSSVTFGGGDRSGARLDRSPNPKLQHFQDALSRIVRNQLPFDGLQNVGFFYYD
jgi:hypothetical protein